MPSQRAFSNEISVAATLDDALSLLSEPLRWFHQNPLVIDGEQDQTDPATYTVTDRLSFLGIPFSGRYTACFSPTPDGAEIETRAALGIYTQNRWTCIARPDRVVIRESVSLQAPRVLAAYVERTTRAAHARMLERLRQTLEQPGGHDGHLP